MYIVTLVLSVLKPQEDEALNMIKAKVSRRETTFL